ncbi:MAG: hypothetical protein FWG64_07940 [Firmicutes bacterium]|nr:hypothetical protein [Bacillota bacterium]
MKIFAKLTTLTLIMLSVLITPLSANWDSILALQEELQRVDAENRRLTELLENIQAPPAPAPPAAPRPQFPNIRLVQPQTIVLVPGEELIVDIEVRNIGNAIANAVLVTASTDGPFSIEFLNSGNVLGTVGQNHSRTIRTRLVANANADGGNYSMRLEFAFRNARDGASETSNDTISVRIDAQAVSPRLTLRNFATSQANIYPGNAFSVSAQLANLGDGTAYNVQAAISDGLSSDGIFLAGSPNAPFIATAEPNHQTTIVFNFAASANMSSGTFPITFELTGRNQAGETLSESFTFFVTVLTPQEGTRRAILAANLSAYAGVANVGQQVPITMEISNTGTLPARNIRIAANPANLADIVPQSANVHTIGVLEPGESRSLPFYFSATASAGSHTHMVGFETTYETGATGDLETDNFEQFAGINVYNPEEEDEEEDEERGQHRPRVLVSAYSVEPLIVSAGEEFDLYMTFQNTSSTRSVHNIRVTLAAVEFEERSGAVFTPVGASNTLFVESMYPREEISRSLRMFTVPNANPRTYNIAITFDYEDEDFNEFTETEQISINVRQITRLEISNLQIPPQAMMFQPVFVDFNIINSGRVTLANLRVALEGNFETSGIDVFVGNMGRGNSTNFAGQFVPEISGEQQGTLIISGEDEVGEIIEFRHEFTIFVDEMMDFTDWESGGDFWMGGEVDSSEDSNFFSNYGMIIGIGVAILAIGGFVAFTLIKKRRSKQDIFADLH